MANDEPWARRILIAGLGSMGNRRARLIRGILPNALISGIDSLDERRLFFQELYDCPVYDSLDVSLEDFIPDIVFACAAPLTHGEIVLKSLSAGSHTFSELNLDASDYRVITETARRAGRTAFLSSTMLYRDEIEIIEKTVTTPGATAYVYHVGQYLPDWHPWEKIGDFFVSDPRTNGCREIFAIELPWLISVFGRITESIVKRRNISTLGLSFPDTYSCIVTHDSGAQGLLLIDVVSRKASRSFRLISETLDITWEGTPASLRILDTREKTDFSPLKERSDEHDPRYAAMISEKPYRKEIEAFLSTIDGATDTVRYSYEDDLKVLQLIDTIEGR